MQKNVCYHTAIYLRLSRDDEDIDGSAKRESDSISSQRELARSFVREQPDMELFDIYIDAPDIIGLKQNPTKRASL